MIFFFNTISRCSFLDALFYKSLLRGLFLGLISFQCTLVFVRLFIDSLKKKRGSLTGSGEKKEGVTRDGERLVPWSSQRQQMKEAVPIMGGVPIIGAVALTVLIGGVGLIHLYDTPLLIALVSFVLFGVIGWWDDWAKISNKRGISAALKSRLQLLVALVTVTIAFLFLGAEHFSMIYIPFYGFISFNYPFVLIPWIVFIIIGTTNAVNLTDGLDGLAISCLIPNFLLFGIAGLSLRMVFFDQGFLLLEEVAKLCFILVGSCLGFLYYNWHPAAIIMGDVGALAFGGVLATIALLMRLEFLLAISGIIFVVETVSVMIQVFSYKRWQRRIFKMTPIHHHFDLSGWSEKGIVVLFGGISWVAALLCIGMLFC